MEGTDSSSSALRQRHHIPIHDAKVDDIAKTRQAEPEESALSQVILRRLGNGVWSISKTTAKWLLITYLLWLAIAYSTAAVYRFATAALIPMCSIPVVGSQLPFCPARFAANNRPVKVQVAASHDALAVVVDRVGQNHDLASQMSTNEYTVRNLKTRVGASSLSRKRELTKELESLTKYTKKTAKLVASVVLWFSANVMIPRGLSRFTTKVRKSIDTIIAFDKDAVKALEDIHARQRNPPTLLRRAIAALSPFAAFSLANKVYTEEQVTHLFIKIALNISKKAKLLLDEAFDLGHNLDIIQETLDLISELAHEELGEVPQINILGVLWAHLKSDKDYKQYQSQLQLLTDMTTSYKHAPEVMKETIGALNRVEADLGDFSEEYAKPALLLTNDSLSLTIALLRKAGERLEKGEANFRQIEAGDRPHQQAAIKHIEVN